MANISHFTQTVNGVSTTYDIHDANAIPRSGGSVLNGDGFYKTTDNGELVLGAGSSWGKGAALVLRGKDSPEWTASAQLRADNGTNNTTLVIFPEGIIWLAVNNTNKYFAFTNDVIPRNGGAVMTGSEIGRINNTGRLSLRGGTDTYGGASVMAYGKDSSDTSNRGMIALGCYDGSNNKVMHMYPSGTWTWSGQPCQTASDARLKQQITEIDDKLLDAWSDVDLVQFKYNDAVEQKGKDKARLHTGFVVQQIDSACKKHGVDISQYGLYCHEVYPEETEEVEIEQADGTKIKEKKIIREASEHCSLRYTEALIVECKYLRRCVERLTARIEQLEKGNNSK